MEYKYQYKLVYPIEGQNVYIGDSYKKCIKNCYDEFKQLDGGRFGIFKVKDLVSGVEYKYKLDNNNKLKQIDKQEGGHGYHSHDKYRRSRISRYNPNIDQEIDRNTDSFFGNREVSQYTSLFNPYQHQQLASRGLVKDEIISNPPSHNLSIQVTKSPESPESKTTSSPSLVIKENDKEIFSKDNVSKIDITDKYNYPYARRTVVRENMDQYDPYYSYDDRDWCIML